LNQVLKLCSTAAPKGKQKRKKKEGKYWGVGALFWIRVYNRGKSLNISWAFNMDPEPS